MCWWGVYALCVLCEVCCAKCSALQVKKCFTFIGVDVGNHSNSTLVLLNRCEQLCAERSPLPNTCAPPLRARHSLPCLRGVT